MLRELLSRWFRRELARALPTTVVIDHGDPLATYPARAADVHRTLQAAANAVGHDVLIGQYVTLWGGRTATSVGLRIGNRVRIYDGCRLVIDHLRADSGIVLDDGVAMNFGCYIDGSGGVSIGAGTILGPNVVVVSSAHRIEPEVPVQASGKVLAPVRIGQNVWIGANAVIRAGVTIGDGAVVGAGSVLTHDVDARTVVVGNPARPIRSVVDV